MIEPLFPAYLSASKIGTPVSFFKRFIAASHDGFSEFTVKFKVNHLIYPLPRLCGAAPVPDPATPVI